ncbi:caspase family protein [Lentzea sp. NBC_00516]|uniref:effector-associated constant component EACC1 n=1 Tax=Lentzea sp. NBC_00516 TaxID=2903582 RepID=UPI002E81CDD1|nr:caspase family protein [Lentzea sp. NBC_00516]WUD29090.1 caspase family protein [Lentzea sp. NBC_00516]
MTDVRLRVHEDGADDERIEQLTVFLRSELSELVPLSGVPGEAPEGAKALDVAELGTLLTTISQSTVLAALITAVSSWLGQRRGRSVTVEADGEALELTGAPTKAELAERSAWLGRHLHRYALIIASHEFADPGLSSLRAPAHDAARLGEVLANPRIGGFHVRTLINSPAAEVNEAVEDFFADREPDDLLVLHFSGHGVKDEAGELHFATSSTKLSRLAGTAVGADFVARRMNRSRSRRIVLLLDCCYSGAFGRGMVARAGGTIGLEEQFGGSGRAVITASSAMEYAFEGAAVADSSEGEPSVFTSALVEGLESGDADRDQDGHVGLDELYEYVYDRVRRVTPHQTPGKWMLDVRGDLRIARRARPVTVPAALPAELRDAIDHSLPGVRAGAIPELRRMLSVAHEGRVLAARLALRGLLEDDSRMVASAAREALGEKPTPVIPPSSTAAPTQATTRGPATEHVPAAAAASTPRPVSTTAAVPTPTPLPTTAPTATTAPAPTSKLPTRDDLTARKLSVPPETMGVGDSASPGVDEAESIPKRPKRTLLTASGSGSSASTSIPRRTPDTTAADSAADTAATGDSAAADSKPFSRATVTTVLPRLAAGLALALLLVGLMEIPGGILRGLDAGPNTFVFAAAWPWALVAALFVITCRDHPWVPGAALGLLAGTTGLFIGGDTTLTWIPLALAATALAVACTTTPWWLAAAGGALGAVGVYLIAYAAHDLTPINDDGEELTLFAVAAALVCLAAYRVWRERWWPGAVAPALLLLDAVLMLSADVPSFVTHASLAGLVVIPLVAALTTGPARLAAYVAIAAGLLVRANDYVSANEPSFTSVAHVTLPLAAAVVAYFSRSR